jgi:aminoglycoside phosphotransferase (APT) family kinase protein
MSALDPSLSGWIEGITGTPVAAVQELTGGASRNSYIVTGRSGAKSFLRLDAGHGPLSGTAFTLAREYAVLSEVQGHGVPVPRVLAFSSEHNAALMEFIPGYTSYQRTGSQAEEMKLRRDLIAAVATLQGIDPQEIPALGEHRASSLGTAIPADLVLWRLMYDERVTIRDPLVEFSLNWLGRTVPDADSPCVIVHGDVGPGNFLIADGQIKALIDWEMTRLGHPLEDIACIIARALGAPFGEPREHVANYEQVTGATVDYRKLDYALSLVLTRWLVGILMALSRPSALQNVPMLFAFRQINGLALVEALCRQNDVPVTEQSVHFRDADPCFSVFAYGRDCLTQMATEPGAIAASSYKLKGVVDMMAYLRSFIDYGPETYEREEIERIAAIVGRSVSSARDANAAIGEHARQVGPGTARPLLEYLLWRAQREQAIMRTSLGDRKDNRIRYDQQSTGSF